MDPLATSGKKSKGITPHWLRYDFGQSSTIKISDIHLKPVNNWIKIENVGNPVVVLHQKFVVSSGGRSMHFGSYASTRPQRSEETLRPCRNFLLVRTDSLVVVRLLIPPIQYKCGFHVFIVAIEWIMSNFTSHCANSIREGFHVIFG